MALEAFRQRIGSIIGGFDAAQAHRRLRGFRASSAHVNTLIAASVMGGCLGVFVMALCVAAARGERDDG